MEGRLSKEKLENFRRELKPGGGLSSYPHPWLMPDFLGISNRFDGLEPVDGDLSGAISSGIWKIAG